MLAKGCSLFSISKKYSVTLQLKLHWFVFFLPFWGQPNQQALIFAEVHVTVNSGGNVVLCKLNVEMVYHSSLTVMYKQLKQRDPRIPCQDGSDSETAPSVQFTFCPHPNTQFLLVRVSSILFSKSSVIAAIKSNVCNAAVMVKFHDCCCSL